MNRKDVEGGDCDHCGSAILPRGKTGSAQPHVKSVESPSHPVSSDVTNRGWILHPRPNDKRRPTN